MPHAPRDLRLDGVRGIAVLAVLAYHATGPGLPGGRLLVGGWLGVDVFFVLSGYLITRLLLNEAEASGRIHRRAFYGRRARRLLPALGVVLAVWLFLTLSGALPVERLGSSARHADAGLAVVPVIGSVTLLYNWLLAFELPTPAGMGHLWSLAVEEQFYLVWPTVLVFAGARGRRPTRSLATLLAGGVAVALLVSGLAVEGSSARDFVYFSSLTSCLGLLFGAAAAIVPKRRLPPVAAPVALTVLALGLLLAPDDRPWLLPPATLIACAATTVVLLAAAGRADRLLVLAPLRYAGRRSYALYLWSSPLAYALATVTGETWAATAVLIAGSFVLAELSWQLVERHFTGGRAARLRDARRRAPSVSLS